MAEVVRLSDKFARFTEYWTPKIAGELNGAYVLLAKLKGEFVWHQHANEDEFFLVIKGRLCLKLRDRDIWLQEGEFFIVPQGVEHCPVAEEEVHVLLFEPQATKHTGELITDRTVTSYEHI
ncbi:MAG TPA: cupin domain-containing protein [Chloroflexia bacterium]|nr:cupin domain-containing protein [Chloroflexia bacterium]